MNASWDAIVVGAGPAGLSAALMLGRARRRVLVIDAGRPRNRFAAHMHGVLGNEGAVPGDLTRRGREEAERYGVEFVEDDVETVESSDDGLTTVTGDGIHRSRALVVATGITDELPDIPGLEEHWGKSVLHCPYCHGWEVADQRLGVLATSPGALHQVQLLRQWSDHVAFFSADLGSLEPDTQRRLQSRGIQLVTSRVVGILGDGDAVSGVRTEDGEITEVDAIFTAGVPRPHDDFLAGLDLKREDLPFDEGSFIAVGPDGQTSHDRIWAIGNVVNPSANVPMSIGAGSFAGGAVNGFLVEEDFDRAQASAT